MKYPGLFLRGYQDCPDYAYDRSPVLLGKCNAWQFFIIYGVPAHIALWIFDAYSLYSASPYPESDRFPAALFRHMLIIDL